jgi:hypothetical protein
MGKLNETVRTVNSAVRTFLFAVLVGAAALGGWKAYSFYNEPNEKLAAKQRDLDAMSIRLKDATARATALADEVERQKAEIEKLETSNRLLKLRHRIAQIRVIDQKENPDTGRPQTEIEFFEVNEEGAPLNDQRQKFTIEGDRIYVDCLLAKFDDKYIEANDLDRRTAICLFQRVFGEHQEPHEGFEIDQVGTAPTSYERGGEMSEFEKRIWRDFWTLANDPAKAQELGIRAVHADAPSLRVEKGGLYELELRTTGEFTFRRVSEPVTADETDQSTS